MASTASLRPVATVFEHEVNNVKVSKSDINTLILDYLTTEGYAAAAERFSTEANLKPVEEHDSVRCRELIQHEILCGRIQSAMEMINDANPEILDTDPTLNFALLRLHLIELIRDHYKDKTGGIGLQDIVKFANSQLAPRAVANAEYLKDLELTMTLLICLPNDLEPNLAALLHPDLRREVAEKVNAALLASQGDRRNAAIRNLMKLRSWAETTARSQNIVVPTKLELGLGAGFITRYDDDDDSMES